MLNFLSFLVIFIFGLIIGSFLNCIIYRLETRGSFLRGRSYCPYCKHFLNWQDLIPVLSFLILKGKCRYCQQKISLQYPLVELTTGFLFFLVFYYTKYNIPYTIYALIITCFLIIIFVYDLKHYIIPDRIIYPAIFVSGIWYVVYGLIFNRFLTYEILNTIYAAFGTALFFLFIVLISRGRWMGVGDVKLAFLLGLILGWPYILVALFLAFFIGAIIGAGLIISGKKRLSSEVPFGPFLVAGTFLAMFLGEELFNWYLTLFLLK